MAVVKALRAREILDSRGTPTLEVLLTLGDALGYEIPTVVASVPSGKSTGSHEAKELRDGEARFRGMGVRKAVAFIEGEIAQMLVGRAFSQRELDRALCDLDGTRDKSRLGANAILGVSLAFARAAARAGRVPLYAYIAELAHTKPAMPQPCFNSMNGGAHADSGLSIQEFMLVPAKGSIADNLESAAAVIAALRALVVQRGLSIAVGDEGGFAPRLANNEAALDLLVEAIAKSGSKAQIGLDAAANYFYTDGLYEIEKRERLDATELLGHYEDLCKKYPICSIEDPFAEDAWDDFQSITKSVGESVRIVGDDLLTTNVERITKAIEKKAVNTVLIKPNQIGTLSETIDAALVARAAGMVLFASHRSGETNDDWIADIAVGLGCEYLKAGSLARGERVAKYNRLMQIAEELAA